MGRVYRAKHRLMHRDVAVKVLHAEVSSRPEVVGRFRQEARAGAMLDHPNICAALDFGELGDGSFFFVMEYLDGPDLATVLAREGPLAPERAVHLGRQIAAALGAAHAAGIVHRDLKPENVVLMKRPDGPNGPDGVEQVKILDFGIAKVTTPPPEGEVKLTQVGTICGTPAYMAPEQAVAGAVDLRSDLYSLGVVLYEMVTGALPFEEDDAWDTLRLHMTAAPEPPRKAAPEAGIPRALERLILRLLEKSPDDRYQSAAEVERALAGVWAEDAAGATGRVLRVVRDQVGQVASGRGPEARRRWLMGGAAAAALAIVAAIGTLSSSAGDDEPAGAGRAGIGSPAAPGGARPGGPPAESEGRTALRELRAMREALGRRGDVHPAVVLLARREFADAATALAPVVGREPHNPHAQRLLAEARAGMGDHLGALAAFERAQTLDPRYRWDPAAALQALAVLASPRPAPKALTLANRLLQSSRATAVVRDGLARLARDSLAPQVRRRATRLLQALNLLSALPEETRLLIQLSAAPDCEERRPLVVRLGEVGGSRALTALKAMEESRAGCGPTGKDDCHACLREKLRRAIQTLNGAAVSHDDPRPNPEEGRGAP